MTPALNVLGEPLAPCGLDPVTGFTRSGCSETGHEDAGTHVVCAVVTAEFLAFTRARGNDLETARGGFPGLRPGDRWCLCASRWAEAHRAGVAPPVRLSATHAAALATVSLKDLEAHAA